MKFNPFKPGAVVHPGMFAGRGHELKVIQKCLFQTKNDNPQNFLIQGERGIGKSSLILFAKFLASGLIESENSKKYGFFVVNIALEPQYSFSDIIFKLLEEIQAELGKSSFWAKSKAMFEKHIHNIEIMSSSFKKENTPPSMLISKVADFLSTISQHKDKDGVCILIDEADKPQSKSDLGSFFKLLTERLTAMNCSNVCIGLAGLPDTIDKLRESHESSLRIFHILKLEPLNHGESDQIIDKGIKDANTKNKRPVSINTDAKKLIFELSEGYPYFVQQFAYNAFESDVDYIISTDDVKKGIYDKKEGALKQLGEKLFNNVYYNQIDSSNYRKVLQYMAKAKEKWVTRQSIITHFRGSGEEAIKDSTINNALKALKERHIILDHPDKKGLYRLPSKSFSVWINVFTGSEENSL